MLDNNDNPLIAPVGDEAAPSCFCSFAVTGEKSFFQDVYVCLSCCPPSSNANPSADRGDVAENDMAVEEPPQQQQGLLGLCQSCATVCHADCGQVIHLGTGLSYCDCSRIPREQLNNGNVSSQSCFLLETSRNKVATLWPNPRDRLAVEDDCHPSIPPTRIRGEDDNVNSSTNPNLLSSPDGYLRDAYILDELQPSDAPFKEMGQQQQQPLLVAQARELVKHSKETFWIGASEMAAANNQQPDIDKDSNNRFCALERLACNIALRHMEYYSPYFTSSVVGDEPTTEEDRRNENDESAAHSIMGWKGLEWWVQVKAMEHHSAATTASNIETSKLIHDVVPESESINLHYDKDEVLAELFGLGLFPALSTVTYLTDDSPSSMLSQPPTVVFPQCYFESTTTTETNANDSGSPTTAEQEEEEEAEEEMEGGMKNMWISHPKAGKHVVFDGRLLHGAPSNLSLRKRQSSQPDDGVSSAVETGGDDEADLRITFLVNLWKSQRPAGLEPLPDLIRQSLLGLEQAGSATTNGNTLNWIPHSFETVHLAGGGIDDGEATNEDGLTQQRIAIPFVTEEDIATESAADTNESGGYGEGEEEEGDKDDDELSQAAGMVVMSFPPPPQCLEFGTINDTILISFGPGKEAYLAYDDDDEAEEDAQEEDA